MNVTPATESSNAINVPDAQAALDGAREILCERFAETAELLAKLRTRMWEQGIVTSTVMKGKETAEEEKFRDYYAYSEAIRTIPSHRALALFRGESLAVLKIELGLGEEIEAAVPHPCVAMIAAHFGIEDRGRRADKWLAEVCHWTWRGKAHSHISTELLAQLREAAEAEAIKIFGRNLHELLLAAPAGPKAVLGIDPGIRTGCKVAVVDATQFVASREITAAVAAQVAYADVLLVTKAELAGPERTSTAIRVFRRFTSAVASLTWPVTRPSRSICE